MKKIIIIVGIIIIGVGIYFLTRPPSSTLTVPKDTGTPSAIQTETKDKTKTILGASVEKRDITAYHFGSGSKELLFVGGIHGGYEWNTALVAYELMDYLAANPTVIPTGAKVTVIPVLNPDGLNKAVNTAGRFTPSDVSPSRETVVASRFNARNVDLNRNFDCDWKPQGVWMEKTVSGGTSAFSEPESLAFKNYIEANNPAAVIVWYSSAGGVFSSSCDQSITTETKLLTSTYAAASGYKAYDSFDFYETSGDMVNWLAKKEIPAISVLLTTHQDTEWAKNKAGIDAVLKMLR